MQRLRRMGCTGDNDKPKRVVGENAGSYSCTDIFSALIFIANLVPVRMRAVPLLITTPPPPTSRMLQQTSARFLSAFWPQRTHTALSGHSALTALSVLWPTAEVYTVDTK